MTNSPNQLNISVARTVRAADGSLHFNLKSDFGSTWISQADFHKNEPEAVAQIAKRLSVMIITTQAKNQLKGIIQNHSMTDVEDGVVAIQQGYVTPEIYVHANGDITQSASNTIEPIVAFDVDPCGGTAGTLKEWKRGISETINGNEIATFILCFGFAPLLLNFSPSHILNPYMEITGKKLTGKTTLAAMAASIYGGDPQSDIGYGFSWDATDGAFPELKKRSAHGLLFLDENNVQGETLRQNGKIAFLQSSTSGRKRMGDTGRKQAVRMALLSTGNKRPVAVSGNNEDEVEAAESRNLHLHFDSFILDECPPGYDSTKDASRALRIHIDRHYGNAVRAFTKKVVEANAKDKQAFESKVHGLMADFYKKAKGHTDVDDRILDTVALCYAAGRLAKKWEILPEDCSWVTQAALAALRKHKASKSAGANSDLSRVKAILERHQSDIENYAETDRPRKKHDTGLFATRTLLGGGKALYCINPQKLRIELGADATTVLKRLKATGALQGQNGATTKLIFPAPVYVPFSKPVYKITIDEAST